MVRPGSRLERASGDVAVDATTSAACRRLAAWATALGIVGLLLGARLDFGEFGLATLADLCSATLPTFTDTFRYRVSVAPWTYAGMFLGCSLGLAFAARFVHGIARECRPAGVHVVACIAGMLIGMAAADALLPAAATLFGEIPAVTRMLVSMALGMSAGTWCGWRMADWLLAALRHRVGDAALRQTATLARTPIDLNPTARRLRSNCDDGR